MIAFRHVDPRFPFLREHLPQGAGRWNSADELAQYFCDTPDGAWAEFLRHEDISDPEDLPGVRRSLWAVEIGDAPAAHPELPLQTLVGDKSSWPDCQREASRLRHQGEAGVTAPAAALSPGGAHGWRVQGGLQRGPARDGKVFVLFGPRPDLIGWLVVAEGCPSEEILSRVLYFESSD